MLGRDNRSCRLALKRGGTGYNARNASNLGGQNRHMGGGEHRVFAAGNVATSVLNRDVFVAQNHAGHGFDLDVLERIFLDLGKVAHLFLSELDGNRRGPSHQT